MRQNGLQMMNTFGSFQKFMLSWLQNKMSLIKCCEVGRWTIRLKADHIPCPDMILIYFLQKADLVSEVQSVKVFRSCKLWPLLAFFHTRLWNLSSRVHVGDFCLENTYIFKSIVTHWVALQAILSILVTSSDNKE